ncbi:alpha-ketoacid dehydrogenase subunit alpha/beta [Spirosoma utsteinense]|uniref:Pyruvate/2-oxoglutarate/acetoin dehydrogenase E1 component n=1 Tax=Spirosoma utsteinense TaxID=2585773 RepID=A0ABR6W742_9BACT|nr:alpha-ketoacid dehydrogenase subunit alpha/beta [Spirosoma utsteinense]MBC3785353.1 pyruvate/2-oxoglutarate/acetoin dehydrogenase E1 component/TPP-dependent pyruvate [Spirosoma utsteinense]MBC3791620.1 pyruvate/2-oxoglutarate/acetoin dehydrogenase E1 component [Spirosoma utsteinense]
MIANEQLRATDIFSREKILSDYRLACESRQASLLGRRDVMGGRAKFGIFGDGKELAQLAAASAFNRGDFRSGYYRDQTFVAALGELRWTEFFAQLYAHTDLAADPNTAGRSMNGHFATRWLDDQGQWRNQTELYNSVCDIAPTAGQLPRALGLAYASKLFRANPALNNLTNFSRQGNEIVFGTIGDASTSQGMFWESMNAAGVLQVPLLMSVWDDGYGISVPVEYQTTKGSISKALAGFQRDADDKGFEIFTVKGWDYVALLETYQQAALICRNEHVPVLVHVQELTQPQGHSTSGSHERYKSKERLAWEAERDCNKTFRQWILENGYATNDELEAIEAGAKEVAKQARISAWSAYQQSMKGDFDEAVDLLHQVARHNSKSAELMSIREVLRKTPTPLRRDAVTAVRQAIRLLRTDTGNARPLLQAWIERTSEENVDRFSSYLYSQSPDSPMRVDGVPARYDADAPMLDGYLLLQHYFDSLFARDARLVALGEDVGQIGDVNQGFAGLQEKYGEIRITDTGIRETTIIGQGIGLAMRGLRPIVEIQYFDYIYYALSTLTDDLATLHYRTKGGQKAPLIVRTRGHRLEGIWHSGSPMGTMISSLRGMHVLVPRNMTQAVGFYNTLLKGDDPALLIESLNGYRLKEKLPANLNEFCVPLGVPEILRPGTDITVVTYGSMCRIVVEAAAQLASMGISLEVIDVQTLLPFDVHHSIVDSIKKTNRVLFADEDVPGGASAYMMQQVIESQNAYRYIDSPPRTLSAKAHRPPYGSDGDYFSKPSVDDVIETVYALMSEAEPDRFPNI